MENDSRSVLITGGARSGKSTFAEKLAGELAAGDGGVLYIATAVVTDEEMEHRVDAHRTRRPEKWRTWEGFKDMHRLETEAAFSSANVVLLDCLGFLLNNFMFEEITDWENLKDDDAQHCERLAQKEIGDLVSLCKKNDKHVLLVTNEVGMGLVPDTKPGRVFRDTLGRLNCFTASICDSVYLCVCGIPLAVKGGAEE